MHSPDGYSIKSYGKMVNDLGRTQPYVDALTRLITPNSVVLDIGTGTGFFALLAAQLGAARVYAIEPDTAIEVGKICAPQVRDSERITWIQGLSTELDLPERADIIIADLHGTMPFYNGMVASLADAKRRHLKPGGTMLPSRDVLRVVPAQADHEYAGVDAPWQVNSAGIDITAGRRFVISDWWRARAEPANPQDLLSTSAVWGEIDYMTAETPSLDGAMQWVVERPGTLHGYYVWFDSQVDGSAGPSNAPDLPELVYGRAFFPLEQPIGVVPGDAISLRMTSKPVDGKQIYRWDSHISAPDGKSKGKFRQSTLGARPIRRKDLERASTHYVPRLNLDGQIHHAAMQAMAQSRPLGIIADELFARFPQRFNSAARALAHVAMISSKYSSDCVENPDEEIAYPGLLAKDGAGSEPSAN